MITVIEMKSMSLQSGDMLEYNIGIDWENVANTGNSGEVTNVENWGERHGIYHWAPLENVILG